jgi:hypothetical protein
LGEKEKKVLPKVLGRGGSSYLLVRKLETLVKWNIDCSIPGICKLGKLLEAGQKECHGLVIPSAPKEIHRSKSDKSLKTQNSSKPCQIHPQKICKPSLQLK